MAKELKVTTKYKKDLKAYKHKPDVLLELNRVIDILISGGILLEKYKNHPLGGNLKDIYDCHVKPNDVLLYKINETEVTLIRFGPHNKLELTENNKKGFDTMIKLHIKEDNNSPSDDVMSLLKNIPDKDIDHHETDLYLRKTPEVTKNVITKLPDVYKKNVTTFRDQIDHDIWYEIPFVFPRGKVRKPTNESKERYSIENLKKLIRDLLDEKGFYTGVVRYNKDKNTLDISLAEVNDDNFQWEVITTSIGKLIDFDDIDSIAKYAEATVDEVIQKYYDLVESVLTEDVDNEKDFINHMATQISSSLDYVDRDIVDMANNHSKKASINKIEYLLSKKSSNIIGEISNKIRERSALISTTDDPYEFEDYFWTLIYDEALNQILNSLKDIETWDISFWDAEEQESYDIKTVRMTQVEVKAYVDKLNAKRSEHDKENGSFYDYVLA